MRSAGSEKAKSVIEYKIGREDRGPGSFVRPRPTENVTVVPKFDFETVNKRWNVAECEAYDAREALRVAAEFIDRVTEWTGSDPDEIHEIRDMLRLFL